MFNYQIVYKDLNEKLRTYFTISNNPQSAVDELRRIYGDVHVLAVGVTVEDWK